MDDEKTVVDPADTETRKEADDAQLDEDLDELLDEFPQETPKTEPKVDDTPTSDDTDQILRDVKSFVDESRQERKDAVARDAEKQFKTDMAEAVKVVKGEDDEDDDLVEGWINARARKDPRLKAAWAGRQESPGQFKRILRGLASDFSNRKKVDRAETEDREAVAAAVRGAATKASEIDDTPKFGIMTDGEARSEIEKKYGYLPSF